MPNNQPVNHNDWERALVITGQWTPCIWEQPKGWWGERCITHDSVGGRNRHCAIPPPPEGNPAAFDEMLDWAIDKYGNVEFLAMATGNFGCILGEDNPGETASTKALALAAVIVALKAQK